MIDWRCESATMRSLMSGSGCLHSFLAGAEVLEEADVLLMLRYSQVHAEYTVGTDCVLGRYRLCSG